MRNYYDDRYFAWQNKAGKYAAAQDIWMYQEIVKNTDTVLDFGCGGGYLLQKLTCKNRYGIDINSTARHEAEKKGIKVFSSMSDLPKSLLFDVIISHHTFEHVLNPAMILKDLRKKLKSKGYLICVVPIDDWRKQKRYTEKDINKHLYTWTPLLLGNLFVQCGYSIVGIRIITQAWIPLSRFYFQHMPRFFYYFLSRIWSMIILSRQIRIVAERKR